MPVYTEGMRRRDLAANELEGHFLRIIERDELSHADAAQMVLAVVRSHARLLQHEDAAPDA